LAQQPTVVVKDRGGVGIAVGVDPDDVVDLAFWHGHLRLSSSKVATVVGAGLGPSHRAAGL
jgi:hypothetical protein